MIEAVVSRSNLTASKSPSEPSAPWRTCATSPVASRTVSWKTTVAILCATPAPVPETIFSMYVMVCSNSSSRPYSKNARFSVRNLEN